MASARELREQMLGELKKLAERRVNDAVRLAFLSPDELNQLDELDLSGLVELKRTDKSFEAKFVDQLKALEMMRQLLERGDEGEAEAFFRALGRGADRARSEEGGDMAADTAQDGSRSRRGGGAE